jgi:hypothetical protein
MGASCLSVPGLAWVRELGRCHKINPRQSTHAWGSGEFVATRLLTGHQGASGDGGCCPVGQYVGNYYFLFGR